MRKWMLDFDDADSEREFRAHDDANGLRAATFAQVVGILFTIVWWNVPHSRSNWLLMFIVMVIASVVAGIYAGRGIVRAVRALGRARDQ